MIFSRRSYRRRYLSPACHDCSDISPVPRCNQRPLSARILYYSKLRCSIKTRNKKGLLVEFLRFSPVSVYPLSIVAAAIDSNSIMLEFSKVPQEFSDIKTSVKGTSRENAKRSIK